LREIGRDAKRFFQDHCTPQAIWTYICDCLNHRR
jgi:hypothetical protein